MSVTTKYSCGGSGVAFTRLISEEFKSTLSGGSRMNNEDEARLNDGQLSAFELAACKGCEKG